MANLELIAPQKIAAIRYSTAPVHNLLCTLFIMNDDKEEFTEWITETLRQFSSEQLEENKMLTGIASRLIFGKNWESFPEWLDHVENCDPLEMQEWLVKDFIKASALHQNKSTDELPSPQEILSDEEAYLDTYEQVYAKKGHKEYNREFHRKEYQLLSDPEKAKSAILSYMRMMWDEHLQPEWERNQPELQDAIRAFESLDFSGMSTADALCRITGREQMPQIWESWIASAEEVVIVPSAHIGPYLMTMDKIDNKVWLVVRAYIPEGANVSSPSLTRSELLMQLSALSNETRLKILELLNKEGELNAHDIKDQLGLTQSATSRHVLQLVATGYLHQRKLEGVKNYSINHTRITQTSDALIQFLK